MSTRTLQRCERLGAQRAAEYLSARTGLEVDRADVETLADAGLLAACGQYKGWPLYSGEDLDSLATEPLATVVAERHAWLAVSLDRYDAAKHLGWHVAELERIAQERSLVPGRLGRYALADVDALAADTALDEAVRAERLLMTHQAASYLEMRESDFKYLIAADLLAPRKYTVVEVTRYRSARVPLYRVGDLDALRDHPRIDWDAVHAVKPGAPSPLRALARRSIDRSTVIRRWARELSARHGVEVWTWWHAGAERWEIDWERKDGAPTVDEVAAAIALDLAIAAHQDVIALCTDAGEAVRWARAMREPGAAVILDTETTDLDGFVIEVAVIDAHSGETLLDTLVYPDEPISDEARWVHGLCDEDVADAPPWSEVLPKLLQVTAGRTVLAYNAEFDARVVARHCHRDGLDPQHLADPDRWACLMLRRSDWLRRRRRLPLGGSHRALGDCQAAYALLCAMTSPARTSTRSR